MAHFLRFRKRSDGEFILINMDHVISIEGGTAQQDEGEWSTVVHAADGAVSSSEVMMSFDELSSMLAGVWEKNPS